MRIQIGCMLNVKATLSIRTVEHECRDKESVSNSLADGNKALWKFQTLEMLINKLINFEKAY